MYTIGQSKFGVWFLLFSVLSSRAYSSWFNSFSVLFIFDARWRLSKHEYTYTFLYIYTHTLIDVLAGLRSLSLSTNTHMFSFCVSLWVNAVCALYFHFNIHIRECVLCVWITPHRSIYINCRSVNCRRRLIHSTMMWNRAKKEMEKNKENTEYISI